MRHRLLPLTLIAAFAACSGAERVAPPPAPPVNWASLDAPPKPDAGPAKATEREAAVASAYTKALGDFSALPTLLDETVNVRFGRQIAHGRDAALKLHDGLFGAMGQRSVTTKRVWLTESFQAIEFSVSGVLTREWMGAPASPKQVTINAIALVWTHDEGTISELHLMFDVNATKAQLGAAPPAAAPSTTVEATLSAQEQANVALVRASVGSFETLTHESQRVDADAGRPPPVEGEAGFLSTLTDDVDIATTSRPAIHGKEEARAYFRGMRGSIGQLDTMIVNTLAAGPFVIAEYTVGGEQQGAIGAIPFTRSQLVTLNMIDVMELRDGKIAKVTRYENPYEVIQRR